MKRSKLRRIIISVLLFAAYLTCRIISNKYWHSDNWRPSEIFDHMSLLILIAVSAYGIWGK